MKAVRELLVLGILARGPRDADALLLEIGERWGTVLSLPKAQLLAALERLEDQSLVDASIEADHAGARPVYRLLADGRDAYAARVLTALEQNGAAGFTLVLLLRLLDELGPDPSVDTRACLQGLLHRLEGQHERWTRDDSGAHARTRELALAHLELDLQQLRQRLDFA